MTMDMTYQEILRDPMIRQMLKADHVSLSDFEGLLRHAASRQSLPTVEIRLLPPCPQRRARRVAGIKPR